MVDIIIGIEKQIRALPLRDKMRLVKRLEQAAWAQGLKKAFTAIDKRRAKTKISLKEINDEVTKARREFHADRR